jgi:hypothetical protein
MANEASKLVLHVEEFPMVYKSSKGSFVTTKVMMDSPEMRKLPFVANDDFADWDEALEEAGSGLHVVNWKVNAGTFRALSKSTKHPGPCFMGDWTVEVRGITARRWTSKSTGDTGVTFKFMGLRPLSIEEGETCIQMEELEVVDTTADSEDND